MKILTAFLCAGALFAVSVTTSRYDNSRISSTSAETVLTPANVSRMTQLASCAVDGAIYGQPLYAPGVNGKNLLIVATMKDSLYAFDADSRPCTAVWTRIGFDTAWSTGFPHSASLYYGGPIGCLASPVVDSTYIYAVCANNTPNWIVWKFDLATGATIASTTIAASVTGTGDPNGAPDKVVGGVLSFYAQYSTCRPGLTLANSNIYVACGSFADTDPWHGWVVSYDTATLTQQHVFCTTPDGQGGAFWMSSGGLAVDGSGNLYGVTGNGDYDGSTSFAMTAVKLSPTLSLLDWYTPSNYATLSTADIDLGSGPPMLIPGTSLLVFAGKDYNAYSVNTGCMGHLGGTVGGCTAPQVFLTNPSPPANQQVGVFTDAFMNGVGYFSTVNIPQGGGNTRGAVYACTLTGSTWNTSCTASGDSWFDPGATIAGSQNGASNGVLWMVTPEANAIVSPQHGTLRAVDPATMTELWNSGVYGDLIKFIAPLVASGKVYVGTDSGVQIFGLPPVSNIVCIGE